MFMTAFSPSPDDSRRLTPPSLAVVSDVREGVRRAFIELLVAESSNNRYSKSSSEPAEADVEPVDQDWFDGKMQKQIEVETLCASIDNPDVDPDEVAHEVRRRANYETTLGVQEMLRWHKAGLVGDDITIRTPANVSAVLRLGMTADFDFYTTDDAPSDIRTLMQPMIHLAAALGDTGLSERFSVAEGAYRKALAFRRHIFERSVALCLNDETLRTTILVEDRWSNDQTEHLRDQATREVIPNPTDYIQLCQHANEARDAFLSAVPEICRADESVAQFLADEFETILNRHSSQRDVAQEELAIEREATRIYGELEGH